MIATAANGVLSDRVKRLRSLGFAVCKPDPSQKSPTYPGWSARSLEAHDFGSGDSAGIMAGPLSHANRPGHAAVILDLDSAEAIGRADEFLPATGMEDGRPAKPRSHRYFLVPLDSIPEWGVSQADQAAPAARAAAGHAGPFLKHFRHAGTKKGVLDFIGTGGQVVCPPSRHDSGELREWVGGEPGEPAVVSFLDLWNATCDLASACGAKLPHAEEIPLAEPPRTPKCATLTAVSDLEARASAYLKKIPGAVADQGGHAQTMWAARVLAYGFDLGAEAAYRILRDEYNGRCQPEWSGKELWHKAKDADRLPFKLPRGWLRDTPLPDEPRPTLGRAAKVGANGDGKDHQPGDSERAVDDGGLTNFFVELVEQDGRKAAVKVGLPADRIADRVREITGDWPKRVGPLLFVADGDRPRYLETPADLFAWIGRKLDHGGRNALHWVDQGADKVSRSVFFAHLQQTCEEFDAVEAFPHWPPLPGHYYLHPDLRGGDGKALRGLLGRFRPSTAVDHDLILALLLSLVAGVRPGGRPAFLITGPGEDDRAGRGIGKTALAEVAAYLVGGSVSASPKDDMAAIKTRLLSPDGRGKRQLLLDNVKTLHFSWDELESQITNPVVSGKRLYHGEGRTPNVFTVVITLNGASLSKDMALRCVPVELARPPYSGGWHQETLAYVDEHRWSILGDLVAILKGPAQTLPHHSRWGEWENLVLARLAEPSDAQTVILERQAAVDDDAEEAEVVRAAFAAELRRRGHDPDRENVFIPSQAVAEIVSVATGERRPTNKASAYLKTLSVSGLRRAKKDGDRGWAWCGEQAGGADRVTINPPNGWIVTAGHEAHQGR